MKLDKIFQHVSRADRTPGPRVYVSTRSMWTQFRKQLRHALGGAGGATIRRNGIAIFSSISCTILAFHALKKRQD